MKILRMTAAALAATCAAGLLDCGGPSNSNTTAAPVISCGSTTQDNGQGICVPNGNNNTK